MTDEEAHELSQRRFYKAEQEAGFVEAHEYVTPQQQDPAYRLAFRDTDFLLREELRPVRFQLELEAGDAAGRGGDRLDAGDVRFGAHSRAEDADAVRAAAITPEQHRVAERLIAKARYYAEARKLAQIASRSAVVEHGKRHFVVCSGGGPSIMEAANRGAADVGAESIGLNIALRHEHTPNAYVTPHLSFQFHYFALRKMHFLLRARAVAAFPGGFGTFDELFELLTLVQTGKMQPIPILLFGAEFWAGW